MPHDKRGAAAADAAEKTSKKPKKARVHETAAAAADTDSENSDAACSASDFELAGEEGNPIHIDSVDDTRARAIMDKYHSNGTKSIYK